MGLKSLVQVIDSGLGFSSASAETVDYDLALRQCRDMQSCERILSFALPNAEVLSLPTSRTTGTT